METRVISAARYESLPERERPNTMEAPVGSSPHAENVVNSRFRCPEGFFTLHPSPAISSDKGYFRLGPDAICYGRTSSTKGSIRPDSALYDVLGDIKAKEGILSLPFDPAEVIDNLRLERYAKSRGTRKRFENLSKRLYYFLRPLINLQARKWAQKLRARNGTRRVFPKWPVDTTVENICETLLLTSMETKGVEKIPFVWFWPDGAGGCLTMTHDVETPGGRDHCAALMDVDDAFGIKSAFGIVPEERYSISLNLLEGMRNRGFEVMVQDLNHDGRLFDEKEEFERRAKIINSYGREFGARGFRAGVLYREPEWYNALEFAYDMSIPNVAHLDPQRGGCCTVMPYFIGDVLELPVTAVQDYMLFHILEERSIDLWKHQIELILAKNGLMSFIIHPDYVMDRDKLPVYKALLHYLQELRRRIPIWCARPSEVESWWRARNKMTVVPDGESWRIEGDNTGSAILAFAKAAGGKLVYEVPSGRGRNQAPAQ